MAAHAMDARASPPPAYSSPGQDVNTATTGNKMALARHRACAGALAASLLLICICGSLVHLASAGDKAVSSNIVASAGAADLANGNGDVAEAGEYMLWAKHTHAVHVSPPVPTQSQLLL